MITVTLNEVDYQLKKNLNEFTIGEFEKLSSIINNESLDRIDRYIQIFALLGIPSEIVEDLDSKVFFDLVSKWSVNEELSETEMQKEIEINGRTYQSFDTEFNLNVKQIKLIEKYIKIDMSAYIGELMAIIFKDTQLTSNEHFVDAHIKHKAKLFRENVTVDIAMPYLNYFGGEIFNNVSVLGKI